MSALVIYTGDNCARCEQAKQIFDGQGIPYEPINIHATPGAEELLREKGLLQLPVINNNGNWTAGFDRQILTGILSTRMDSSKTA